MSVEDSAHQRELIYTTNTNVTADWQSTVVRIGSRPIMRVTFEGVRGKDYQGDIALDDISFETCQGELFVPWTRLIFLNFLTFSISIIRCSQ